MPIAVTPCAAAVSKRNFATLRPISRSPENSTACSPACCGWWGDDRFFQKVQIDRSNNKLAGSSSPRAPSRPAAADTNDTWRHGRSTNTSRCTLRTPFFPARHTGLPDIAGQLLSRVAELEVDGSKFLGLRHIHGPLNHLADLFVDLWPKLLHDRFNTLFPSFVSSRRK